MSSIPLILLYTENREGISGSTRFQKLVFLAEKESDIPELYEYIPHKYGPYSPDLSQDLQKLSEHGLIERNHTFNGVGNRTYTYSLTTKGIRVAKEYVNDYEPLFRELSKIKQRYNKERIDDLLDYVYRKYPNYTTETELDKDKLSSKDASQFLTPDIDANNEYRFLRELSRQEAEITNTGEKFERMAIKALDKQFLQIERYDGAQVSVYWPTITTFEEYLERLSRDQSIQSSSDAEVYMTSGSRLQGKHEQIKSTLAESSEEVLFYAVASHDDTYEITWEKNATAEGSLNEITTLFKSARSTKQARTLVHDYFSPELLEGESKIEIAPDVNDDVRIATWEISQVVAG